MGPGGGVGEPPWFKDCVLVGGARVQRLRTSPASGQGR